MEAREGSSNSSESKQFEQVPSQSAFRSTRHRGDLEVRVVPPEGSPAVQPGSPESQIGISGAALGMSVAESLCFEELADTPRRAAGAAAASRSTFTSHAHGAVMRGVSTASAISVGESLTFAEVPDSTAGGTSTLARSTRRGSSERRANSERRCSSELSPSHSCGESLVFALATEDPDSPSRTSGGSLTFQEAGTMHTGSRASAMGLSPMRRIPSASARSGSGDGVPAAARAVSGGAGRGRGRRSKAEEQPPLAPSGSGQGMPGSRRTSNASVATAAVGSGLVATACVPKAWQGGLRGAVDKEHKERERNWRTGQGSPERPRPKNAGAYLGCDFGPPPESPPRGRKPVGAQANEVAERGEGYLELRRIDKDRRSELVAQRRARVPLVGDRVTPLHGGEHRIGGTCQSAAPGVWSLRSGVATVVSVEGERFTLRNDDGKAAHNLYVCRWRFQQDGAACLPAPPDSGKGAGAHQTPAARERDFDPGGGIRRQQRLEPGFPAPQPVAESARQKVTPRSLREVAPRLMDWEHQHREASASPSAPRSNRTSSGGVTWRRPAGSPPASRLSASPVRAGGRANGHAPARAPSPQDLGVMVDEGRPLADGSGSSVPRAGSPGLFGRHRHSPPPSPRVRTPQPTPANSPAVPRGGTASPSPARRSPARHSPARVRRLLVIDRRCPSPVSSLGTADQRSPRGRVAPLRRSTQSRAYAAALRGGGGPERGPCGPLRAAGAPLDEAEPAGNSNERVVLQSPGDFRYDTRTKVLCYVGHSAGPEPAGPPAEQQPSPSPAHPGGASPLRTSSASDPGGGGAVRFRRSQSAGWVRRGGGDGAGAPPAAQWPGGSARRASWSPSAHSSPRSVGSQRARALSAPRSGRASPRPDLVLHVAAGGAVVGGLRAHSPPLPGAPATVVRSSWGLTEVTTTWGGPAVRVPAVPPPGVCRPSPGGAAAPDGRKALHAAPPVAAPPPLPAVTSPPASAPVPQRPRCTAPASPGGEQALQERLRRLETLQRELRGVVQATEPGRVPPAAPCAQMRGGVSVAHGGPAAGGSGERVPRPAGTG
eukprot:TRINITY_DN28243_c0_g1_i2.p1 TRINITY_DN28243_c0_g1~~TRINITY_DN28243_c0_g1_i2.p1  ORF type:complete len:1056 (+),score=137.82 TRINITY_DN28243_c0_g1_i2:117-3284(+)